MIPLWLFTLGTRILNSDDTVIKIPFFNIVSSLLGLLLPIAFGIYLQVCDMYSVNIQCRYIVSKYNVNKLNVEFYNVNK